MTDNGHNASNVSIAFTLKPDFNTFSELLSLMIATNNQIILKLDPTNRGPAVELIAIGSIGSDSKLAGVRSWHRIASYKNIEWFDVNIRNSDNTTLWVEISDAGRLIKLINSMRSLADSHDTNDDMSIQVFINESNWIMRHPGTNASVSLPVRWFDSKWAAATITNPSISVPRCCVKLVSGLDQISAILKRIDKWREEWSVDLLSIAVQRGRESGVWDMEFTAETSTPPHVKLSARLPNCPEQELSTVRRQFEACQVTVSLGAATRALITPLAENEKLCNAPTGIALMWVPEEGLACNINWNALGVGQITTTIYIPSRIH